MIIDSNIHRMIVEYVQVYFPFSIFTALNGMYFHFRRIVTCFKYILRQDLAFEI